MEAKGVDEKKCLSDNHRVITWMRPHYEAALAHMMFVDLHEIHL